MYAHFILLAVELGSRGVNNMRFGIQFTSYLLVSIPQLLLSTAHYCILSQVCLLAASVPLPYQALNLPPTPLLRGPPYAPGLQCF